MECLLVAIAELTDAGGALRAKVVHQVVLVAAHVDLVRLVLGFSRGERSSSGGVAVDLDSQSAKEWLASLELRPFGCVLHPPI